MHRSATDVNRALLVNDFPYRLLTFHMGGHGQDASTTEKYTQDVGTPINLVMNERLRLADDRADGRSSAVRHRAKVYSGAYPGEEWI